MKRLALLLALALLPACPRNEDTAKPAEKHDAKPTTSAVHSDHDDEPEHESLPRRVRLSPEVIADAKIETKAAAREALAATIELPGELSSDPDKTARVSALIGGRIESVSFKEGQQVKKGDLLATITVIDLGKAKAALTSTTARATAARANADRLQVLADKGLAAAQEVLAARADAEALAADARAAEEHLRALGAGTSGTSTPSRLALRAPITGVVVARDALVGQPVTPDQIIATIADLDEVWFLGRVFEKNLGQIHVGAAAEILLNAYPKERFGGTVEYLGKQIDPSARTVVARIRIANRRELLRLGLFGVARVAIGEEGEPKAPTIVVPRSAVTEIGARSVVFVKQPDGDFDVHEVLLGEGALGRVQVLNGLREGEQIVVEGVFTLKSVVLKSTFGGEE